MRMELPPPPEGPDRPLVLVRVYPGYHEQATELFQADADHLARFGYLPWDQSYVEGRYGSGYTTIAVLAVLIGVGVLLLLYMHFVRPAGTLAVTYVVSDLAAGISATRPPLGR